MLVRSGAPDARHRDRVSLWHMQDKDELTVELERERRGTESPPSDWRPTIWSRTRSGR